MSLTRDRRRRVLADDQLANLGDDIATSAGDALPGASGLKYALAAKRENQPRFIDLVPLRALPFTLVVGTALILFAALLLAYTWLPALATYVPAAALAPLNLENEHCLANWLASLLLLSNMQIALLVYSVRRHRVDDYHGRYRVWLAVAFASLVASVDLATGLNSLVKVALAPLARMCGVAEHYGFWTAVGLVGGYLTLRLVLETKRSWGAILAHVFAAAFLTISLAVERGWIHFEIVEYAAMTQTGSLLVGCLAMLSGTLLFGRYVMLDVEGKIKKSKAKPAKPAKPRKVKSKEAVANDDGKTSAGEKSASSALQKPKLAAGVRTDVETTSRPSPLGTRVAATSRPMIPTRTNDDDDEDADEDASDTRGLSRAERKRLKREAKLARRAA